MRLRQVVSGFLVQTTLQSYFQVVDDSIEGGSNFVSRIGQQQPCQATAFQRCFLLTPNLNELAVNETENCGCLDLLLGPLAAFAEYGLVPDLERPPRLEVILSPFLDDLFIRVAGPFNLPDHALPEEDDEVVAPDAEWHI